ncbi:PPE family protein [Mycolicibacter heraklionensis]|uniref:PPE family protein n=1 Tax=Mycolicibacter heraklionensis TaxID=512402 RepID=UPI00069C2F20|nr:PPE family protein [Mycolicibacter heraklionensis]
MSLYAPPEVTSAAIYAGPGAAPLEQAALAWQQLADELHAAAQAVTAVTAGIPWHGSAATSMRTTVGSYVALLTELATSAANTGQVATAAATAFQQVHAAVASPAHIAANRQLWAMLTGLNILGQYSTAIALLESAYEQMWAQDIAAMHAYAAAAATATGQLQVPAAGQQVGVDTATDPGAWLDETFQSLLSDAPYELPTSVLALMTGLWAASSVAAVPDVLNRVRNIIESPAVAAPTPSVRTAVAVRVGAGGRIGGLTVPPNWAQPPKTAEKIPDFIPGPTGTTPLPAPIPLALPNINQRSRDQHAAAQPRYGDQPTVMPKHPAGG